MNLRDRLQEVYELGPVRAAFRAGWEIRRRLPTMQDQECERDGFESDAVRNDGEWITRLPFTDPLSAAQIMRDRIPGEQLADLRDVAIAATKGRIKCFSRWFANFGEPLDWHVNPLNGQRWNSATHASRILNSATAGDIKVTWEVGRFPQAYHFGRAAAFFPGLTVPLARVLATHIESFVAENPAGRGVHWASAQEVVVRLLAWIFGTDVLLSRVAEANRVNRTVARALGVAGTYVERHIAYARFAVYNNHLLTEALGLYAAGVLLRDLSSGQRWRALGRRLLEQEAERQFSPDGAYISHSHNYHRGALLVLLWACAFARASGEEIAPAWRAAMDRSLEFLLAQQNPDDGSLPNYGGNDGSLLSILTTCDFTDFRPVLQAVGIAVRGERLYDAGPWDELPVWFFGPRAVDAPLRPRPRSSVSFQASGYHVLRGRDESSFGTFRCGSLRDRFSQIDMLHLDVWWKGQNVLVDAGSYQYNGAAIWHEHFFRTAVHNTVTVDGRDQMLHLRQFKVLYWTRARLLHFEDTQEWTLCEGEHYGYLRGSGNCIHRRSILFVKNDLWCVVDTIVGEGSHSAALHWLAGPFDHRLHCHTLALGTPRGPFRLSVFREDGQPLTVEAVRGRGAPPRGWLSRYYGEKQPVPSVSVEQSGGVPLTFVSILAGGCAAAAPSADRWHARTLEREFEFRIAGGRIVDIR